eukprot:TRINITY_DN12_c0_g1_i1.p1 TRINITY_DN12_c0_g1~~TRINITY_DN12_c0_g1_i1.p1  ORF type:complete len:215 (-),score=81.82 TRINITY_DN12_c0_g1_i1:124-768(-)
MSEIHKIFKFGNLKDSKGAKCDIHNKRCGYVKGEKTRYCNLPAIFKEKSFYEEVFKGKSDSVPDWETFKERVSKKGPKCCRQLYDLANFWKADPALFEFNIKKKGESNFCDFHDGYCSEKKHNNVPELLKANFDSFYNFTFSKDDDVDKDELLKRIEEKKKVFCPSAYKAYKKWIFSHPELKKPVKRKLDKINDEKKVKNEKDEKSNKKTKTKK